MIQFAKSMGVQLEPTSDVDGRSALMDLAQEISPGADFGIGFGIKKAVENVLSARSAAGGSAPAQRNGSTIAFGIRTSAMSIPAAMAAADRLLGDPAIKNAQSVVRNTQALAALGDPAAKRGLLALQAVGTIRAKVGAKPGQKVVRASPAPARTVTIARSNAQVRRMATKVQKNPGVIRRVINWFKAL